jgi:hypothetical protein
VKRLFLAAAGLLLAVGALAQQAAAPKPVSQAPPEPPEAAPKAGEPLTLQMKEVEIRGEVERPEVFYIIPRKEARLEPGPLSKDFSGELQEPLLPGPFEESVRRSQPRKP